MHFSEIIKLQFGKERHTLLCILTLSQILLINIIKCVVTSNFLVGFQSHLLRSTFPACL